MASSSGRPAVSRHVGVRVLGVLCLVLVAGCGTRVSGADVVAAAGASQVSLSPASIAALRHPAPSAAAAVAPPLVQPQASPSMAVGSVTSQQGQRFTPPVARPISGTGVAVTDSGPGPPRPVGGAAAGCAASLAPVAVGQVGTFSGVAGAITVSVRRTMAVWASDVNARGGLACHPVTLYSQDDQGDPARAAAAVAQLVADRHVVALVGNIVTFSIGGFRPAIEAAHLPAVGGDMIAPDWNSSLWMFPQGAGIDDQLTGLIKAGVVAGHKRFGFLYCVEVSACSYADRKVHDGGAAAAGAQLLYEAPVSITQPDYTAQCLNAHNADVDLLGLGLDGASMTRLARSCEAISYRPLLAASAATMSPANADDLGLRSFGLVSASGVAPWMSADNPALRAFHVALARWAPGLQADGESMIAWSSGKLLEAAVDHLSVAERSGALTAALVTKGLGGIHDEDLGGLTAHLTFTPGSRSRSSGCVFFERLGPLGWTAPDGSRAVCGR